MMTMRNPVRPHNDGANLIGDSNPKFSLTIEQARKHEQELIDGGDPAVAWDARADARQAAWDASPFAASATRLFAFKGHPAPRPQPEVIPFPPFSTGWWYQPT